MFIIVWITDYYAVVMSFSNFVGGCFFMALAAGILATIFLPVYLLVRLFVEGLFHLFTGNFVLGSLYLAIAGLAFGFGFLILSGTAISIRLNDIRAQERAAATQRYIQGQVEKARNTSPVNITMNGLVRCPEDLYLQPYSGISQCIGFRIKNNWMNTILIYSIGKPGKNNTVEYMSNLYCPNLEKALASGVTTDTVCQFGGDSLDTCFALSWDLLSNDPLHGAPKISKTCP